jgi:hypothetical protein
VAEGGALLRRYMGLNPYRGFESLSLRHPHSMMRTLGRIALQLVASGPLAIFYPFLLWTRGNAWLRWSITAFMLAGVLLAAFFGLAGYGDGKPEEEAVLVAWMLGGPVVVAAWNLWRMHAGQRNEESP